MKKCFLFIFICFLSVSCASRIQVASLQSNNLKKDSTAFYFENDTLLLKYNFHSHRGVLNFSIYNKLNIPLYIDWKKTAFIVGKNKMDYWADEANLLAHSKSYSTYFNYRRTNYGYSFSNLQGTISKAERITFIPPGTEIGRQSFILMGSQDFAEVENAEPQSVSASWNPTKLTKIKKKEFTAETSPLTFRNYITYSTKEDFSQETYIDNFFWVNEVKEMKGKQYMGKHIGTRKDHSYIYSMPYKSPDAFYH